MAMRSPTRHASLNGAMNGETIWIAIIFEPAGICAWIGIATKS